MSPKPERETSYPTSAFDYVLPPELIASHPAARRDESRLLVVERASGSISHHVFREFPDFVAAGDAVVLNETRVIPARLRGTRAGGGAAEVLLLRPLDGAGEHGRAGGPPGGDQRTPPPAERAQAGNGAEGTGDQLRAPPGSEAIAPGSEAMGPLVWEAMVRPGARLRPGRTVMVAPDLKVEILAVREDGTRIVRLHTPLPAEQALERYGRVPLPPYIDREPEAEDVERYQTVFARERGSVAAPTAGLHFTPAVLGNLEARGARLVRLVLHIGAGTFRPVEVEDPGEHRMHAEWYEVPPEAAAALRESRASGAHCWAVGTTVTRTLETLADEAGRVRAGQGWTDIFIRPPYRFRAVDRLLTNFHLPRSTLLMLVAAFAGRDLVLEAYRQAVERKYRFYSYGDAMLIL